MNIKTIHDIGDKVFVLDKNEIKELEIFGIKVHVSGNATYIKYILIPNGYKDKRKFFEEQCFDSKEELLKTL